MKILFVHPSVELYGADKILLYILKILSAENEITVLLPKEGELISHINQISSDIKVVVDRNLPIVYSKIGVKGLLKLPSDVRKFKKLFHKNEFDILYCNTLATTMLLFTNWSKTKIIHVHEIIENKILNFGFSVLIRINTKKVICVSEHVKKQLIFSKCYKTVHNGIPDLYKKDDIKKVDDTFIRFVLPGRYMPKKGQWFLIDALKLIPIDLINGVRFELYGSAPPNRLELENDLLEYIKNANLEAYVKLSGFRANIAEIYQNADVLLVPSMMPDPFPTTVIESMMFSKPLITTNHGGASEIVESNFGLLVAPGKIEELKNAIIHFLKNKNCILEMGLNARKKYENELTLEAFENRFKEVLNNFLENK